MINPTGNKVEPGVSFGLCLCQYELADYLQQRKEREILLDTFFFLPILFHPIDHLRCYTNYSNIFLSFFCRILVFRMLSYILPIELFIFSLVIQADPGLPSNNQDSVKPQSQAAPYNYYGHRQAQYQTASPYLNKRNPEGNVHASEAASPYGNAPARQAANQCKLHINCPSKKSTKRKIR